MYEITGIKLSSTPAQLDVISDYFFQGRNGEASLWMAKAAGVDFVRKYPNYVYTSGNGVATFVEVVEATTPYLRTQANGTTGDNLLSLPVY